MMRTGPALLAALAMAMPPSPVSATALAPVGCLLLQLLLLLLALLLLMMQLLALPPAAATVCTSTALQLGVQLWWLMPIHLAASRNPLPPPLLALQLLLMLLLALPPVSATTSAACCGFCRPLPEVAAAAPPTRPSDVQLPGVLHHPLLGHLPRPRMPRPRLLSRPRGHQIYPRASTV